MSKADKQTNTPSDWAKHLRPKGKKKFNREVRTKWKKEIAFRQTSGEGR